MGQQLHGRLTTRLPRIAVVCLSVLNATNIVFMAIFSYFASKSVPGCAFLFLFLKPFELTCFHTGSSIWSQLSNEIPTLQNTANCSSNTYAPSCGIGNYITKASDASADGITFAGYGSICEGCSLVIMLVSFVAAGILSIRRFYKGSTLQTSHVGRRNNKVRRQIIATVTVVFVTFLIRSVYAAVLAASRRGRIASAFGFNPQCVQGVNIFCDPCQQLGFIVQSWLFLCPAFPFTVFLLSSPVTILVALWAMTGDHLKLELRKKTARFESVVPFIKTDGS